MVFSKNRKKKVNILNLLFIQLYVFSTSKKLKYAFIYCLLELITSATRSKTTAMFDTWKLYLRNICVSN